MRTFRWRSSSVTRSETTAEVPLRYRRILLKLSGEAFAGPEGPLSPPAIERIVAMLLQARERGAEIGVVAGGGNFLRGGVFASAGTCRATADQMGMLATVINSLALQEALVRKGLPARVLSALEMNQVCEPFTQRLALHALSQREVLILAGGTGNPFFTTDTAAALRAAEISAEVLLKATKVDGIYSTNPKTDPAAIRFDRLTHDEVLTRRLEVMDLTAITLCQERSLPILVFDMHVPDALPRILQGEPLGTLVTSASSSPSRSPRHG